MTILEISYPKSGTHLLWQILQGFTEPVNFPLPPPFFSVYESDGIRRTAEDAVVWLKQLQPDDVAASHLYAWKPIVKYVREHPIVTYFIYRDPRDVCISYVHHVTALDTTHYQHDYYMSLSDFDAQLLTSILNVPGGDEALSNISKRFEPYLHWLDCSKVMSVRFEDLIHYRFDTLARIITHYQQHTDTPLNITPDMLETSIHTELSPTYNAGRKTGKWKEYFKAHHKMIFKDVAGDLLIKLGYEKNNDW
jgi:hypothetical protein